MNLLGYRTSAPTTVSNIPPSLHWLSNNVLVLAFNNSWAAFEQSFMAAEQVRPVPSYFLKFYKVLTKFVL